MTTQTKDIQSREDIETLVNQFYTKADQDPYLGPVFNDIAKVNWDHHLPKMYGFWESILFGEQTYQGQPFPKHAILPLKKEHFRRWVALFEQTLDEYFKGVKTEEARQRARTIAKIFQHKMGLLSRTE